MFKISNKIFSQDLTSSGKLKQKIWGISVVILLPSLLLIDVINVRTASNQNWMTLLIKNIYLIIPWGLAYLVASRHRGLIKIFTPLYFSLVVLVTTGSLAFHHFAQTQDLNEKCNKEMANILKDFSSFINGDEVPPASQTLTYSADEYGHFAVCLNKYKQSMELSKLEARSVVQAFNEVELNSVFSDEVLFNFLNIIEKKKKLQQLLIFLDESEKRTEDAASEFIMWMLSSPDVDEISRKNFAEAHYKTAEEKKSFRIEPYKIKKNIVSEFIKLLDFLSKIYGTYENGVNSQIIFTNANDIAVWQSHYEAITNLFKEEENFALLFEQRVMQMGKALPTTTKTNHDPVHTTEEYGQAALLLNPLEKFMEFCKQEEINMERADAEIDVNSICTEEVIGNFANIIERKKKLEQMCVTLDESEKKWDELMPDLVERILSLPNLDDQIRKKFEGFNKSIPNLIKQSFAIKKGYVLEFLKLLNLVSMGYGTYKINNEGVCFSSEIESKLYESYMKNIRNFMKEELDIDLLVEQRIQELSN